MVADHAHPVRGAVAGGDPVPSGSGRRRMAPSPLVALSSGWRSPLSHSHPLPWRRALATMATMAADNERPPRPPLHDAPSAPEALSPHAVPPAGCQRSVEPQPESQSWPAAPPPTRAAAPPAAPEARPGAVRVPADLTAAGRTGPVAATAGVVALVVADLLPLAGVLFLGWEVFPIVLLFWLENIVVGVVTILKMATAEGTRPLTGTVTESGLLRGGRGVTTRPIVVGSGTTKAFAIGFFCLHYGMFTLIQGVFVIAIFGFGAFQPDAMAAGEGLAAVLSWWFPVTFLGLCVSHGVSYWRNYIQGGEYRSMQVQTAMLQPYGRVVVMQLTVIIGGMLVGALGTPVAGLVLLILLKTGLDLIAHRREHRKARAAVRAPSVGEAS